jgi:hypothetical protein
MCGDFSENSSINSLLRDDSAKCNICARTGTPPRRRHESVARGNRLFTMAHDCIGKDPSKSVVNTAAFSPERLSVRLSAL